MPRFDFDFSSPLVLPFRLTGTGPRLTSVRIERGVLDIRFGLLRLRTPLTNVAEVMVTGPYNPIKTLGVHVSLADRGLTFGTSAAQGVCISFERPVAGVLPVPFLTHPAVTVTVSEPEELRDTLLGERDLALVDAERLLTDHEPLVRAPAGVGRTPTGTSVAARQLAGNLPDEGAAPSGRGSPERPPTAE